jgi:hypothetical protein
MVERFREQLSNEVADRIARMVAQLDHAADDPVGTRMRAMRARVTTTMLLPKKCLVAGVFADLVPPFRCKGLARSVPRRATGRRPGL